MSSVDNKLDEQHHCITEFLGGLSPVKLDDPTPPSTILEVGCGSGAWAIQAAHEFPRAHVVAVDINPIPPRPLPDNLEFQLFNVSDPCPFKEQFDVVHARLMLIHVPKAEEVLHRFIELVKPGGWLLVEEPDVYALRDGNGALGPGLSAIVEGWMKVGESHGVDSRFGSKLRGLLETSDELSEVHVDKVVIPVSGKAEDPKRKKLGLAWQKNYVRIGKDLPQRWANYGITEEVGRQYLEELLDPSRDLLTDFYFSYSRKRG
ncbi:S-adenosyl-L-methionine-dependent methyltransferase [Trametes meyenii]|nr:S-adenosyl-L-methionine-dependent methyltransferase [Trametes meyenii]